MPNDPSSAHQDLPETSVSATTGQPAKGSARTPRRRGRSRRTRYTLIVFVALLLLSPFFLSLTGSLGSLAQAFLSTFVEEKEPVLVAAEEVKPYVPPREASRDLTFGESAYHPDRLFQPYFGPLDERVEPDSTAPETRMITPFRSLLDLFMKRQGEDDNFTIRVFDNRTGKLLELYTMVEARRAYERTGEIDWLKNDKLRRAQTGRLVAKHEKLGTPKKAISAKWGRRNQVLEAREREAPLIEYEMRLARYLGLSLLATEIGTVETFNQDWLVSSVGARSRYQMMPYVLRQGNLHRYKLATTYGKKINVHEELHPLLTMEPAFRLLRGYVNAVGHEVPGLSAYHTGPGNIFKLYKAFLDEASDLCTSNTTVLDAYVWAVTEGFESVSKETSFRQKSQGYVAAGYGSLRAVEDLSIDTTMTLHVDRVQLKPGATVDLSELLTALVESGEHFRWARGTASLSLYERFRHLNPHFVLPPGEADSGIPPEGNVRLVAEIDEAPVRFFLPPDAAATLASQGLDVIDQAATFRFDHNTYATPDDTEKTVWDEQYATLIHEISRFGFTVEHRKRLYTLARKFEQLAVENPSHYRITQRTVIQTHKGLWSFRGWDTLAEATETIQGKIRLQDLSPRPPERTLPLLQRLKPRPPKMDTSGR